MVKLMILSPFDGDGFETVTYPKEPRGYCLPDLIDCLGWIS